MRAISRATRPHNAADANNFVMPALMQKMLGPDDEQPVRLYRVTFGVEARTNWHRHDDVQVLFGLSGQCIVVDREGTELLLNPGDVVAIDPEKEHWHGAAPGTEGEHLAINTGEVTTWLESSA
jgi:quercetin dioxygenase-like cupin family protein